jgi:hypothetical protein
MATSPTYKKAVTHVAPAPIGANGVDDATSGMQLATVNGTIGNDGIQATLPGQDIGAASDADFHEKQ